MLDGAYVSADPLPASLVEAARDVAQLFGLASDWLNGGPTAQLKAGLPPGFEQRVHSRRIGGLVLHLASRTDQVFLKLFAAVDDGPLSKHVADLQRLAPTVEELEDAAAWVKTQDAAAEFSDLVDQVVNALRSDDDGD